MFRRALWIGGATLMMAACGPMPGYVAPSERHTPDKSRSSVEYSAPDDETARDDDDRDDDVRVERRRVTEARPRTVLRDRSGSDEAPAPTVTPTPAPTVAPTPPPTATPEPTASPTGDKLQVVPLGRADSYYLIDRTRGLCFFIHKETSAAIDCSTIPEGRDVAAPKPPTTAPAPTPAPTPAPARTDESVRRRYVEPAPAPTPAPHRAAPAPAPDPDAPTADELNRFETAYVSIACDRRQGSFTPPQRRVEEAGLSQERYSAIESWLTSDERAWRLLVNRAYRECDQGGR